MSSSTLLVGCYLLLTMGITLLPSPSEAQMGDRICRLQADFCFVVDSSGSINDKDPGNWGLMKQFMKAVVNQLDVGPEKIRVAVIRFSNKGSVQFNLDAYNTSADIVNAIERIGYVGGDTNTSGGLWQMLDKVFTSRNPGDRPNVPNIGIVITDGVSTTDNHLTVPYARIAQRRGIKMIAIGVTDDSDTDELTGIASDSSAVGGQTVYQVDEFANLQAILIILVEETCIRVTTTTSTTTTTTTVLPGPPACRQPADLVIILDSSGSVQASNFNDMKNWLKTLVLDLDMDNDVIRLGLQTFSDSVNIRFHLNRYNSRKDILSAIDNISFRPGGTNTAEALRIARQSMFTESNGDRENVRNVIFLITDGRSANQKRTLEHAQLAKEAGIHIFVTIVGNWFDEQEINAIASHPYERNKKELPRWSDLNSNFKEQMTDLFCNNQNECASSPCANAVHCRDELGFYFCICAEGWGGVNCNQRCDSPADIVFALDASTSIRKENFEKVVDFVRSIIDDLRIGTTDSSRPSRIGMLTFSNNVDIQFHLKDYKNKYDILNAFPPHYAMGDTRTSQALSTLRTRMFTEGNGDQASARNIAIVITDGYSGNERDTWREARLLRESGVEVISVGIGSSIRLRELEAMASYPNVLGENVLRVENFNVLDSIRNIITRVACGNHAECNNRQCRNGAGCKDRLNGFECLCTDRYTGKYCERRCSGKADIVFAIDASGSIRRERFPVVKNFVKGIIENLEISLDKTRVGAVSWSDGTSVDFHLNAYRLKEDVLQAVEYIPFRAGRTHTSSALRVMRDSMFTASNGDREDVPNYAYIITDGNSNINQQNTIKEAIEARVDGIHIVTISVGQQLNRVELKGMASEDVQKNMFSVESFNDLPSLTNVMPNEICDSVNECRSSPCQAGGTCIDSLKRYICLCREGRTGYNCQYSCRRSMDLVILLDLSGSTEDEYDRALNLTKRIVYGLDMSFGRSRVGVITYGDQARVQFNLNKYNEKEEVINALRFMPNIGDTNTQAAINRMRNDMFRSYNGDRAGVPNIGLLISDGRSNINRQNTIPEAERAKNDGIAMYVVAVGDEVDMMEVNDIAGTETQPPSEYTYRVTSDDQADFIADRLIERLCQ